MNKNDNHEDLEENKDEDENQDEDEKWIKEKHRT